MIAGIDSQYHVFAIGLDDRKLLQFQFPTIQDVSILILSSIYSASKVNFAHAIIVVHSISSKKLMVADTCPTATQVGS